MKRLMTLVLFLILFPSECAFWKYCPYSH